LPAQLADARDVDNGGAVDAGAGLVGAIFRLTLAEADGLRNISLPGLMAGGSASHVFSLLAPPPPPLQPDWFAAFRRRRMAAAFLTSKRSCEGNFHPPRFS
jgi:hypothetical protein